MWFETRYSSSLLPEPWNGMNWMLCGCVVVWVDNNNRLTNLSLLALIVFFFSLVYPSGRPWRTRERERGRAPHQKEKNLFKMQTTYIAPFPVIREIDNSRNEIRKKTTTYTHERCRSPPTERDVKPNENAFWFICCPFKSQCISLVLCIFHIQ